MNSFALWSLVFATAIAFTLADKQDESDSTKYPLSSKCLVHNQEFSGRKTCQALCWGECKLPGCGGFKECIRRGHKDYICQCKNSSEGSTTMKPKDDIHFTSTEHPQSSKCLVHNQEFSGRKTCQALCWGECKLPGCGGYKECIRRGHEDYICQCKNSSEGSTTMKPKDDIHFTSTEHPQSSKCLVHNQEFSGRKTCQALCWGECKLPGCGGYKECIRRGHKDYICQCKNSA